MTFNHNCDYSCDGKKPHGSAISSFTQAVFLYNPVEILPYISVLLPIHSVHTPFGDKDNHLVAFISARPLALTDQQESDTTGRAEGVKQHHTHHLCDLQMNSTAPNIMLLTFSVVMSKLTYAIRPCSKIVISKIQPL